MITLPNSERQRFKTLLAGQSKRFGLTPEDYLRKIWYHEQASRIGEYVAMTLVEELLPLVPTQQSDEEEAVIA